MKKEPVIFALFLFGPLVFAGFGETTLGFLGWPLITDSFQYMAAEYTHLFVVLISFATGVIGVVFGHMMNRWGGKLAAQENLDLIKYVAQREAPTTTTIVVAPHGQKPIIFDGSWITGEKN